MENDINKILTDTQIIPIVKNAKGELLIHLKCNVGITPYTSFILDTGAQCSLILASALKPDAIIYPQFRKAIAGIAGNVLESKGTVFVAMNMANKILMHEFQVMQEDLFETQGLFGVDLLNEMDILTTSNKLIVRKLSNEKMAKKKKDMDRIVHFKNEETILNKENIKIFSVVEEKQPTENINHHNKNSKSQSDKRRTNAIELNMTIGQTEPDHIKFYENPEKVHQ